MYTGKLIVVDGGDGAGKATQVALLAERLRTEGWAVETLDFPQYTQNTFGQLLRECLDGKRGDFIGVDARIASTLYAADRYESKPKILQWLEEGKVVILDRYTSANMLHQGGKIRDEAERRAFLGWIDHVEHHVFGLPRPDLIVYLNVPFKVRTAMKRAAVAAGKHGVTTDQHEASKKHQEQMEESARTIVSEKNNWQVVTCTEGDAIRTREDIHADVYGVVRPFLPNN